MFSLWSGLQALRLPHSPKKSMLHGFIGDSGLSLVVVSDGLANWVYPALTRQRLDRLQQPKQELSKFDGQMYDLQARLHEPETCNHK